MRDQDVLRAVSDGLSGLDMAKPVEEIISAGTSRRRRRVAAVTMAGVALVGGGLAVGVPALTSPGPVTAPTAQRSASVAPVPATLPPAHLVAFTVVRNPDATVTLTFSREQLADPGEVRRALAEAGVPAEVRVNSICFSSHPAPPGLDRVLSASESAVLVITPSALPKGAVVSIGYHDPSRSGPVAFGLAWRDRLTCRKM
ncbi:hypothetical protein V6V47_09670 [Micromonospora sp. CPCC 205539]|uniref:hypothetical protein n=1 Tax=Micromonospora sp. CPCC 205539 TaxID=3122408 RepID=UPI002FF18905